MSQDSAVRGPACPAQAELDAFRSGSLPDPEQARVAEHVLVCPACLLLLGDDATRTRTTSDTDPNIPILPTVIGPYRIVRVIGRGGMGTVYEAVHEEMSCRVAVKVLSRPEADPEARTRFRREWQAVGRLSHPNVVRGLNAGHADGVPYLAMEMVDGPDVGKLVREAGRLAPADAASVVVQAARGLAHAHAGRVVHRDVKPSNLLLAPDGVVKVLDLGLAQLGGPAGVSSGRLSRHTFLGTADYMAPEQWDNPAAVGPKADVYGLGCVLNHLLTGRPPFSGPEHPSPRAKMKAHKSAPPPDPRTMDPVIPAGVVAVLHRMLAKEPADRPDMAAVATALAPFATAARLDRLAARYTSGGFADGQPTAPGTPYPADITRRQPRPRRLRRRVILASVAVLAATALGILLATRNSDPAEARARPTAKADLPGEAIPRAAPPAKTTARPAVTLDGFAHPVVGVSLNADGQSAFTAEQDGTIRRWDLATRKSIRLYDPKNPDLSWSLRDLYLAPGGADLVAYGSKKAIVLDALGGEVRKTILVLRNIWSVALSADGKLLAIGHDTVSGPHNPTSDLAVSLFDVASGERTAYWMAPVGVQVRVAFGPDGTSVLAVNASGQAAILDPARSSGPVEWSAGTPGDRLVGLTPFGDGQAAAVLERETAEAGRCLVCRVLNGAATLDLVADQHTGWSATATGAAADGRVGVVGTSSGYLIVGGMAFQTPPAPFAAHDGKVECVAVSADGRRLISAGADERVVKVWNVPDTNRDGR